jgi:hypothetical protein
MAANMQPTLAYAYAFGDRVEFAANTEGGPFGLSPATLLGMPNAFELQHILQQGMRPGQQSKPAAEETKPDNDQTELNNDQNSNPSSATAPVAIASNASAEPMWKRKAERVVVRTHNLVARR